MKDLKKGKEEDTEVDPSARESTMREKVKPVTGGKESKIITKIKGALLETRGLIEILK